MPTLRDLIKELGKLDVDVDEIRMPGQLYDDLVDQAEIIVDNDEKEG